MSSSTTEQYETPTAVRSDSVTAGEVADHFRAAISASFMPTEAKLPTLSAGDRSGSQSPADKTSTLPGAQIGAKGEIMFCSTPVKDAAPTKDAPAETPEQRLDQKIKDKFGSDVFDHLKDWDWLIANREKLEEGFKKLNDQEKWDVTRRMRDLSTVDGKPLIYTERLDGPTRGSLIPKRHDIYLRRGSFRSDNYLGQFYH
jgi:hypothetical protein